MSADWFANVVASPLDAGSGKLLVQWDCWLAPPLGSSGLLVVAGRWYCRDGGWYVVGSAGMGGANLLADVGVGEESIWIEGLDGG